LAGLPKISQFVQGQFSLDTKTVFLYNGDFGSRVGVPVEVKVDCEVFL